MTVTTDHWSIGEVLSLLQDEFPEITISKIRFLESQGLISPERTPSGYRRFYQSDFDRLHWILVQQRDHYLPLKVIRDRLDSGDAGLAEPDAEAADDIAIVDDDIEIVDAGSSASDESEQAVEQASEATAVSSDAATTAESSLGDAASGDAASEDAEPEDERPSVDDLMQTAAPGTDPELAAKVDAAVSASSPQTERREGDGNPDNIDHDIALTKEELADASGCGMAMIHDLERFSLITGREIGPAVLYDGEALMIARLASQFGSYGLDPRHLRTFLVGAQREVELLFQVVEPMLYRKDPEMRKRSLDTLDDLVELSANLRAILMRQRVRAQLPSQRG